MPTHDSVLYNRPSLVSSHPGQSLGLLVNATFTGYVEARLIKTPLHFPSLMALRSISGVVLVVLVEVRGEEETVGRRRGHQSASAWRSLQHQRGASGGCGLVQSRGGCGLRSMLCSIAVTQPLLLWCVIDAIVAVY